MRFQFALVAALAASMGCLDVPDSDALDGDTVTSTETVDHDDFGQDCGRCHHVGDETLNGCETCHGNPPATSVHSVHDSFDCAKCHPQPTQWLTDTHPNAKVDTSFDLSAPECAPCHGGTK